MWKTHLILCFLLIQSVFILQQADADLNVDLSPNHLNLGLTDALEVNCSFTLEPTSGMTALISLIVSRSDFTGQVFTELVTINDFSGQHVNLMTSESVTATGEFKAGGESYLYLLFDYPTGDQAGMYRCSAQGFDSVGHIMIMTATDNVTAGEPSIDDWQHKITELDMYTKNLEQLIKQMGDRLALLEAVNDNRIFEMFENHSLSYSNHKYYVSKDAYSDISLSMAICHTYGGHLVEINDVIEYQAVQAFLKSMNGITGVVISGTDEGHEGTWTLLSTGAQSPYVDWGPAQPNGDDTVNCLALQNPNWQMNDWPCQHEPWHNPSSSRFLCEIPSV